MLVGVAEAELVDKESCQLIALIRPFGNSCLKAGPFEYALQQFCVFGAESAVQIFRMNIHFGPP